MKKIKTAFIALMMMGLGAGVVNAQDKAATTTQTDKKAAPASGQHLKKDGTPDKRYKENKDASAAKSSDSKATKPATKNTKVSKTATATK